MAGLEDHLRLNRCPHCSIDNPNLEAVYPSFSTTDDNGNNTKYWRIYKCKRCGGVISAYAVVELRSNRINLIESYPSVSSVDAILPDKVKAYLQQAIDSTFAPAGSVMLCASAVDEMLKVKGYTTGNLYSRINTAATNGLLTPDMEKWAHQVRLDANDQRHADVNAGLPTVADAKLVIEFTRTLAEFLFVLPAKVTRGIASSTPTTPTQNATISVLGGGNSIP